MQLSILLLAFYSLNILCCLLALKTNIKYQIASTQRKIRILAEKTIKMQDEQKQKHTQNNFCKVYAFLFKNYTLIGLLLSRKPGHGIIIIFSFLLSYSLVNFGVHWAASASIPFLSALISIIIQYEYYKCIFFKVQQENINKITQLMSYNKLAIVIYTTVTISSLAILLYLTYSVFNSLNGNTYGQKLIGNGFILGLDSFIYKPLIFILTAKIASQSHLFLDMIQQQEERKNIKNREKQVGLKGVINISHQQLNEIVNDGDYQLKQTRNMFISSIFNKKYESQNQFVKSKSINHLSNNKQFFFLPDNKSKDGVQKQQSRKTAHFFAINELQMNIQCQLSQSLGQTKIMKGSKTLFNEIQNKEQSTNYKQQPKILSLLTDSYKNQKNQTENTQNTLSDSYVQRSKKQQDQKSKFYKLDKHKSKQISLMKVEQLQTEMQEEHLQELNRNTVHRYLRTRKRRPTATHSQLQQQNLIKIYLDGNKQQIKDFKPKRRQSQITLQIVKRNRTGKYSNDRSKPIVHQRQFQPNFFKLSDL